MGRKESHYVSGETLVNFGYGKWYGQLQIFQDVGLQNYVYGYS